MRKSILVTAAIAVTAGGLALAFSQTEQGKAFFQGENPQKTTSELIASAITPETTPATPAATPTATTEVATATPAATATPEPAATMESPAMTPVDLNKTPVAAGEAKPADTAPATEAETPAAEATTAPVKPVTIDVAAALQDRSIGSEKAPVTVYDFSSLSCPHCAHFHNDILPKIKKYYIDTGKVRWVFHGFPLNEPALKGEMISRCAPVDQYEKLQDLMYQNQERWAFSETPIPSLNMLLRLAGITDDMFLSCANNTELQAALLKKYQEESEKYKINSTPTFVFNDGEKTFSGAGTYEGFAFDLDALLKKAGAISKTPVLDPSVKPIPEPVAATPPAKE